MSDNKNILENIVDSIDNLSIQQNRLAEDTLSRDESVQKGLADTDQRLQEQINQINSGWDVDLSKNYPSEIFSNPPDISGEYEIYNELLIDNKYSRFKFPDKWIISVNKNNKLFFNYEKYKDNKYFEEAVGMILPIPHVSNKWYATSTDQNGVDNGKSEFQFLEIDNHNKVQIMMESYSHSVKEGQNITKVGLKIWKRIK